MAVVVEFRPDVSAVVVEMDVSVHIANHYQLFHHQIILKRVMVETANQSAFLQLNLTNQLTILINVYCRKVVGPCSDEIVVGLQVPDILIRRTISHHLAII